MAEFRQRQVENAVAGVRQRYAPQALLGGSEFAPRAALPHVSTGFAGLDAMTGCGGAPLGMLTLISGRSTLGKLTLAYKVLANAQRSATHPGAAHNVGLIDLSRTADPEYVARCGVDLEYLLVGRPALGPKAVTMIGDLVQSRGLRALVVDSLSDLAADKQALRAFNAALPRLQQVARRSGCALLVLDEPHAPWLRWFNLDASNLTRWAAALHLEMQREQWLRQGGELIGYRAQTRLLKSRWVYGIRSTPLEVIFHGTAPCLSPNLTPQSHTSPPHRGA